ncbi:hypothetical protein Enr13x_10760 [Stieleria neptunia]|uniref:Uncharacterized protein n=1 Tax=Stieleria neptunia TaxID=2527979 RepID=A0A518HK70_9BACT|nr:hypothetical protein [Stieleria neptunia]QDV41238.1 hypothetical protein Enr13x_10760 [Stieleria neptunia]
MDFENLAAAQLRDYDRHQPGTAFAEPEFFLSIEQAYELQFQVASTIQEFLDLNRPSQRSIAWLAMLLFAIAWPPIYSTFIHLHVYRQMDAGFLSADELKNLLDARRYTIDVPMELDGHFLTFDAIVDGKATQGGGSSVEGGTRIVLLLRRDRESRKIEYCWLGRNSVSRGILDDPLTNAGTSTERSDGAINPGDWLLRGGRSSVQIHPAIEPAEFELRLAFSDP